MADHWRKREGHDTWHKCANCSNWPTSGYKTSYSKPTSGEFCNECLAKQKANNCR
jgi:hypothetical protein